MKNIEWKRGLLRLWIIFSVVWVSGSLWLIYPQNCFVADGPWNDYKTVSPKVACNQEIKNLGAIAFIPPLGLLIIGTSFVWAFAGFTPRKTSASS